MGRAKKRCNVRGCDEQQPCPVPGHRRKPEPRTRAQSAERAQRYGTEHRTLREKWKPYVESGTVRCRRASNGTCLEAETTGVYIAAGTPWQLGHPDEECPAPIGPEHRRCNTATRNRPERHRA